MLFCLGVRSREGIAALAVVMSLVQGFDGIIGILAHDPAKTYGPFVFAPANFVGLVWLLGPTERVGEKVFYGRHLSAAKPKVNSAPELVSDVECSAAPEPGVGKFRFSRGAESLALATTMPPFFGWLRKSSFLPKNCRKLLYQRTTGSSNTITMCSTNIPARRQM